MKKIGKNGTFTVTAYQGDFKTLLAFNMPQVQAKSLAGFTIEVQPGNKPSYYLYNTLQFKDPTNHAQVASEPPHSSINAPFQKFRWTHVPGQDHQGTTPFAGSYTYMVTPRYFSSSGSLLAIDTSKTVQIVIQVMTFSKGNLTLGFTRGFTQSQAFSQHFGVHALIEPKNPTIDFDTSQQAGRNSAGDAFTFLQEYQWSGWTARQAIFDLLDEVQQNPALYLDVFAYDLNEPDIIKAFLALAREQRIRIILDDAPLHHLNPNAKTRATTKPKKSPATPREDLFEAAFRKADGGNSPPIMRGHFKRYSHDKVLIVSDSVGNAQTVLTGSTNFSVTGLYVNSNHVLVFRDPTIASTYKQLFDEVFQLFGEGESPAKQATDFEASKFSQIWYKASSPVQMYVSFAPHAEPMMEKVLGGVVNRVKKEQNSPNGNVIFAVMQVSSPGSNSTNMVFDCLTGLNKTQTIFTYGVSDSPGGIVLYKRGKPNGVLVTGKPIGTMLPPPFDQVRTIPGPAAHQIHDKFVVCGLNGSDPTVFCGSSNLAEGGELSNGDNLLEIHDDDVATVFAIEGLDLVDHFDFLDRYAKGKAANLKQPPANPRTAADAKGITLSDNADWAQTYYDPNDLHLKDRQLFGA